MLAELLPPGFTVTNAVTPKGTYSNAMWSVGGLGVGSNASLTVIAAVGIPATGSYATNTLAVADVDQALLTSSVTEAMDVVIVSPLDLALSKSVDDLKPNEGDTVVYSLEITNRTAKPATGITVAEVLPASVSFLGTAGDGAYSNGMWILDSLGALGDAAIDILATVNSGTAGSTVTNEAWLMDLDQVDTNTANNTAMAMFVVEAVDLVLGKTASNPVSDPDQTISFSVQLLNHGPDFATGIEIVDSLPPGILITNAVPTLGVYSNDTWFVSALGSGGSGALELVGVVQSNALGTLVTNHVHVAAVDQTDIAISNNYAFAIVAVDAADLTLTKSVDNALPDEGDTVQYTVVVSNRGPNTASSIQISDPVPAQLTFSNAVANWGAFSNGVWSVDALPPQTAATLAVSATVNAGTSGTTVTNTVMINSHDQADTNALDNVASSTLRVKHVDISVSKVAVLEALHEQEIVNFVIDVRNDGLDTANNVRIADPIPSGLTFSSFFGTLGTYSNGVWAMSQIFPGGDARLTLIFIVDAGTCGQWIANIATLVSVDETDPVLTNNESYAAIHVVPTNVPLFASAGAFGSIVPSGLVWVAYGQATNFVIAADPYFHIQDIMTNAESVGSTTPLSWTNFTWGGITESGSVQAAFAANLATNETPEWWLAMHGLTNSFDAEALADQDLDGAWTWAEHVAGTDPTNQASVFAVTSVVASADAVVLTWYSVSNKTYAIEKGSSANGGFSTIASNLPATPPLNVYTAQPPAIGACYYRVRVK